MKRLYLTAAVGMLLVLLAPIEALAGAEEQLIPRPSAPDFDEVESILAAIDQDVSSYIPEIDLVSLFKSVISGTPKADAGQIFRGLAQYFFHEVRANAKLLGALVVLAVISAFLQNLQVNFNSDAVARLGYSACHLVLITLAVGSFGIALKAAHRAVLDLVSLMRALLPTVIMLIASSGAPVTAGLLSPVTVSTVQVVATVVADIVLPLVLLTAILDIINNAWDSFNLSGLSGLLRLAANTGLGVMMAIFLGIIAVQKAAGAVPDGAALRMAKFLSNTFVPVVGKMFSDAAEMVFSSSSVLKAAVGAAGAIVVFFMVAFPIAKILSLVFVYRLAGALVQPLGAGRIVNCLNSIGNSLVMVCVSLGSVAIMLWISLAVLASASRPV